jgi:hypothetical protein
VSNPARAGGLEASDESSILRDVVVLRRPYWLRDLLERGLQNHTNRGPVGGGELRMFLSVFLVNDEFDLAPQPRENRGNRYLVPCVLKAVRTKTDCVDRRCKSGPASFLRTARR